MVQGRSRIMVVDSQPAQRMLICSQLRRLGYEGLTCANDGTVALARLKAETVDVVILDVELTVEEGRGALAALRADPALHRLPVVVITSRADQETVNASLALGVSGYLIKPASTAAIDACLRRALCGAPDIGQSAVASGS